MNNALVDLVAKRGPCAYTCKHPVLHFACEQRFEARDRDRGRIDGAPMLELRQEELPPFFTGGDVVRGIYTRGAFRGKQHVDHGFNTGIRTREQNIAGDRGYGTARILGIGEMDGVGAGVVDHIVDHEGAHVAFYERTTPHVVGEEIADDRNVPRVIADEQSLRVLTFRMKRTG
ncbi:MAG: hypothetical protein U9Q79_00345 [Candidatus Hydrogenedentes bacterium]|nr:hypothetical protein [Candidatus Hydrogenedentota bacterium]